MCLFVEPDAKPQIAEEDIPCFKLLEYHDAVGLVSIYQGSPYKLGEERYAALGSILPAYSLYGDGQVGINEGLHSFADMGGPDRLAGGNWTKYIKVFNAIIPKGAEYYVGRFAESKSYCSNKLIVTGEIS